MNSLQEKAQRTNNKLESTSVKNGNLLNVLVKTHVHISICYCTFYLPLFIFFLHSLFIYSKQRSCARIWTPTRVTKHVVSKVE